MSMTGQPILPRYSLIDHHGRTVTEQDFLGRYQLIFFGFTHCRAVCPRALSKLGTVLDELGHSANNIQPLYVSVDPERDTPEIMRAFLEHAYPRFLGLTGSPEQAHAARAAFRVHARRGADPENPDGYAVPHTALTYLLDPTGAYLAHFPDHLTAAELTNRLTTLMSTGRC